MPSCSGMWKPPRPTLCALLSNSTLGTCSLLNADDGLGPQESCSMASPGSMAHCLLSGLSSRIMCDTCALLILEGWPLKQKPNTNSRSALERTRTIDYSRETSSTHRRPCVCCPTRSSRIKLYTLLDENQTRLGTLLNRTYPFFPPSFI